MTRVFALLAVLALSYPNARAGDAPASGRIVVDASKSGGTWWVPQSKNFDPAKNHQGKRLADYFRSRGWKVDEIGHGEDVTDRLKGATIVIRWDVSFDYKDSEVRAYREFVAGGGKVLLVRGFVSEGAEKKDKVANEFGIVFSKTVRTATINRWAQHPLTKGLDWLPYAIGSIVTASPKGAESPKGTESTKAIVPIAYLDKDQLVSGIVVRGKGKVVFISTIFPLMQVSQPFTTRVLEELTRKN